MARKHDEVARNLARKEGVQYNEGPGADIQGPRRVIEVEGPATVGDAGRQLQGYKKPVYVAGADQRATEAALQRYQGTSIGVMNPKGKILKPSSRNRK